ncbi:MAG: TetR/AcrR family transcriptional regulator [Flavobacteriales bacterium]|nr:TetR/AcrR family transcriptional regulator [Flavobacteriales bacterium]
MHTQIGIIVNDGVFLKDPESSELGRSIVEGGIDLVDEIGFEAFTFRKLAQRIGTTEASVYRYFESKHRLLLYLSCWYWRWMDYRLMLATANIDSAEERLKRAVRVLVQQVEQDSEFSHINEVKLNRIIISESSKAYLNKMVDQENKGGFFADYKELVQRVSDIIIEVNPEYKYPHMLVSTIIEGAHLQRYFAEHLPRLTDVVDGEDAVTQFCLQTISKTIT